MGMHRDAVGHVARVVGQALMRPVAEAQRFPAGCQHTMGTHDFYAEIAQQIAPLQAVTVGDGQGNLQQIHARTEFRQRQRLNALVHKPAINLDGYR